MCYTCNLKSNAHANSEPMMVREESGCNRHMVYIGSISDINPLGTPTFFSEQMNSYFLVEANNVTKQLKKLTKVAATEGHFSCSSSSMHSYSSLFPVHKQ